MQTPQKKFIIITSIFQPTDAVKKFSKIPGWRLIVVGDKKTPPNWNLENVTYLSPEQQEKLDFEITRYLPWNHYSRKMIGYLYAIKEGADIIYDTDDDNAPLERWYEPQFSGVYKTLSNVPFVNTYSYFTKKKVWPRGIPLQEILNSGKADEGKAENSVSIWQFLANNEPDVDAIYRLVDNTPITFENGHPIVLEENTVAPINSQNTFFAREAFPLLFLPAFVTFRFTDILRGLVSQPILWTNNSRAGFGDATVIQERNEHDYLKDFESEVPMYLHTKTVVQTAKETATRKLNYIDNLKMIYFKLHRLNIVTSDELRLLEAWGNDLKKFI